MAIEFHRLTAPLYNEATLGVTHDYINHPAGNVPPGGADAPFDGKKGSGVYLGTYFVALGEEATAAHFNRPSYALAENCDYLDDLVHRDLVTPYFLELTAAGDTSSVPLVGEVFVGDGSYYDGPTIRGMLVAVLSTSNRPIAVFDPPSSEEVVSMIAVDKIHDGADNSVVGNGYHTNPTINVDPPIPDGTDYKVLYFVRKNVATQAQDILPTLHYAQYDIYTRLLQTQLGLFPNQPLPNWKDGTTNPVGLQTYPTNTVGFYIKQIISDLVSTQGSSRVNSKSYSGTNLSLSNDVSIYDQLVEIVDYLDGAPVFVSDDIPYPSPPTRETIFLPSDFFLYEDSYFNVDTINSWISRNGSGGGKLYLGFTSKLPQGAVLQYIEVLMNDSANILSVQLSRNNSMDWGLSPAPGAFSQIEYESSPGTSSGDMVLRIPDTGVIGTSGVTMDKDNLLHLRFLGGTGAIIYAVKVHWTQPSISYV